MACRPRRRIDSVDGAYPKSPRHLFIPRDETLAEEYEAGWAMTEVFPANSVGIVTGTRQASYPVDERRYEASGVRLRQTLGRRRKDTLRFGTRCTRLESAVGTGGYLFASGRGRAHSSGIVPAIRQALDILHRAIARLHL